MTHRRTRPVSLYVLMVALLVQGVSAVVGGTMLVADPSGRSLNIPTEWLHGSPFADYLVPGLILLVVLGIGPLIVLYGLWARRSWSLVAALVVGLALLIWITVEIRIIGYQTELPFQLIYGLLGLAIVVLDLLPSVRAHYAEHCPERCI